MTLQTDCCTLHTRPLIDRAIAIAYNEKRHFLTSHRIKAGTIPMNLNNKKILIVQSYSNSWGLPKGSVEGFETPPETALRETLEETGIQFFSSELQSPIRLLNCNAFYYPVFTQRDIPYDFSTIDTEITGIGWVHLECLGKFDIPLNYHLRQLVGNIETIFKKMV
jgi:8-oxo-dGTP pyrophosphatase MutT (NUDIX family)